MAGTVCCVGFGTGEGVSSSPSRREGRLRAWDWREDRWPEGPLRKTRPRPGPPRREETVWVWRLPDSDVPVEGGAAQETKLWVRPHGVRTAWAGIFSDTPLALVFLPWAVAVDHLWVFVQSYAVVLLNVRLERAYFWERNPLGAGTRNPC